MKAGTLQRRGLSARQVDYLLGRLCGKSKRGAALSAGYAKETADSPSQNVEGKARGCCSPMPLFVRAIELSRREIERLGKIRKLEARNLEAPDQDRAETIHTRSQRPPNNE